MPPAHSAIDNAGSNFCVLSVSGSEGHLLYSTDVIANFMNDTLDDFEVTDRQTFIKFLDLLRKNFLENPESWENKTLPDFLEALSAYSEDIQGYYDNMKPNVNADQPNWSTFADILKGATIYE